MHFRVYQSNEIYYNDKQEMAVCISFYVRSMRKNIFQTVILLNQFANYLKALTRGIISSGGKISKEP